MNDEVKEILDNLIKYKNDDDKMKWSPEDILTIEDVWLLLDYITNLQKENGKLNNIINELDAMFDGDLDGFFTINEKGACNNIIEVIQNYKDKLKELKEGEDNENN